MKQAGVALALVFLVCWFGQGSALTCMCNDTACINTQMSNSSQTQFCCLWVDQPVVTNPNSLVDANGTPLGFLSSTYRGTDSNRPDLCVIVNIPPGNIRYVVVSVESNTQICIRRRNAGPDDEITCGSGGVFFCQSYTSGTNVELEFYCNGVGSCPVNDESFYFKPVVTALDTDDEYFCDNVNRTLPSSLIQDPQSPNVEINPPQLNTGGATSIYASHILPALMFVMLLVTTLAFH